MSNTNMNNLKKEIIKLKNELDFLKQKLTNTIDDCNINYLQEKIEEKEIEIKDIEYEMMQYKTILDSEPVISNENIELYKNNYISKYIDIRGEYIIYLASDKTIIGKIGYEPAFGVEDNVYIYLTDNYRNKGLGSLTLSTFLNYLSMNNVETASFIIEKRNTPSIKMVEKVKNIFPNFELKEGNEIIAYHYQLNNVLNNNHPNTIK